MPGTENEAVITARYDENDSAGLERLSADMKTLAGVRQMLMETKRATAPGGAIGKGEVANIADMIVPQEQMDLLKDRLNDVDTVTKQFWDDMGEWSKTGAEQVIYSGYMAMADALTMLAIGAEGGGKRFAKAMLEMSAQAVLAIGQQAAVKALFALAEGLLFKDPTAFAAAKLYGAVAAMAMATGVGLKSAAAGMATGGGGGGGGGYSAPTPTETTDETKPGIVVNVRVEGHVVDSKAFVEDHVAPALAEAVGRGVAASAEYNLNVERD